MVVLKNIKVVEIWRTILTNQKFGFISTHICRIIVSPGGLAAVGGAPLGMDMETVLTGGESSYRAADTQGRQVGPLFQLQASANTVS